MDEILLKVNGMAAGIRSGAIKDSRPPEVRKFPHEPPQMCTYYRLLYEWVRHSKPKNVVELGTFWAASAYHLAHACPESRVITIDIDPASKVKADALKLPNLTALTSDSVAAAELVKKDYSPIDVLFIDSEHSYKIAAGEWAAYRPLCRDGAVVFMDDIAMNPGMKQFWAEVKDPKVELHPLHVAGFGAAVKRGE